MDKNKTASSAKKLALISEQRSVLEKVVKISLAITRLQTGLESMISLGKADSELSEEQVQAFEIISTSIQHQPTDKLKSAVAHLDSYIHNAFFGVLTLVEQGEKWLSADTIDPVEFEKTHHNIHRNLNIFRRKSQTAVVVRLLLKKRGINTPPFDLPIPEADITEKVSELKDKEKSCRHRIDKEIDVMVIYVDKLLETKGLPEATVKEMQDVKDSLQKNKQHLRAGKSIEELPIVFEIIEMGNEQTNYYLDNEPLDDDSPTENKELLETSPEKIQRGFFNRVKAWLSTPLNVGWKDIDKYK